MYCIINWQEFWQSRCKPNTLQIKMMNTEESMSERQREEWRFTCVPSVHLRHVLLGKPHCSFKPASHFHGNTQTPAGLCQTHCPYKRVQARRALALSPSPSFRTHPNMHEHTHTHTLQQVTPHTTNTLPTFGHKMVPQRKSNQHSGAGCFICHKQHTYGTVISCINSKESRNLGVMCI